MRFYCQRDVDPMVKAVTAGDGSAWRPIGGLNRLWRGGYWAEYGGHEWLVDVDYFDFAERIRLYRDGIQDRVGSTPARFELNDEAHIQADLGLLGMKRVHLVTPQGEWLMQPVAGSLESGRRAFARRAPRVSALIEITAVVVLIAALIVELPQLLDSVSNSEWFGRLTEWNFTSPWWLAGPVNAVVAVAGALAALERGLSMRYSPWLD